MGRDAGRHADRDALGPVYEQVRDPHRKYQRFFFRLVKVGAEIDHIFIQIRKAYFLRKLCQPGLRVTHGRGAVPLDRTEVSVAVHQDLPFLEILGHDNQRFIDRTVPVRMVFTHGVSHDTGAFPVRPVIADAQLVHIVKGAPLYRFETVAHIREGTGYDHAHGVIDI